MKLKVVNFVTHSTSGRTFDEVGTNTLPLV